MRLRHGRHPAGPLDLFWLVLRSDHVPSLGLFGAVARKVKAKKTWNGSEWP
jgi:hypothetical protein